MATEQTATSEETSAFKTVAQAREYLKQAGYAFGGFGALTHAEVYKRNGTAVLLRRKAGQWVLV